MVVLAEERLVSSEEQTGESVVIVLTSLTPDLNTISDSLLLL